MVGGDLGLDEDVVNIDLIRFTDLLFEHYIDQPLVAQACILKSKGHHLIAKKIAIYDE